MAKSYANSSRALYVEYQDNASRVSIFGALA